MDCTGEVVLNGEEAILRAGSHESQVPSLILTLSFSLLCEVIPVCLCL